MSDIDRNHGSLSSTGPQIDSSSAMVPNLFSIALYLVGIYFAIAASRRHVKETLSSGGKARIQLFWQHIASTLILTMPYLRYDGLPNTFTSGTFSMGRMAQYLLLPVAWVLVGLMLLTLFVALVAGLLSGVTKEKKENSAKDESGDAKP